MSVYELARTPRITAGVGARKQIATLAGRDGHALLVADPGLKSTGLIDEVAGGLRKDGLATTIFDEFQSDPTIVQADAAAALAAIRLQPPQLLFLDIQMDPMNGIDLAGRLRTRDIAAPVILITGYPDENISAKAAAAGVRHVLLKPLLDESLAKRIRGAIQEGHSAAGHPTEQ